MSGYIVSARTITKIVVFVSEGGWARRRMTEIGELSVGGGIMDGLRLARALEKANRDAYQLRYKKRPDQPPYALDAFDFTPTDHMRVLRALGCYLGCSWESNAMHPHLFRVLGEMQYRLAHIIVCDLQAYNELPWE